MKVKLIANLNIDEVFDMDDDLTIDEISDDLWKYIGQKIEWDWDQVDDDDE
ncbi:hypothetical protein [Aedoeadaptatus coxii]|uniref:hypothetical protein n=1 Tax=Aedoeadaptatus coxii TaxID=755172 RepID=UPI002AD2D623|nr:hypothetical protein [Peptoniphilus coxii]